VNGPSGPPTIPPNTWPSDRRDRVVGGASQVISGIERISATRRRWMSSNRRRTVADDRSRSAATVSAFTALRP
jgi:hypothetical protein